MLYLDILQAFLFGITAALAIGPIGLLIINNGIRFGFHFASGGSIGAAFADSTYSFFAFAFGSIILTFLTQYEFAFTFFSSLLLIGIGAWLGMNALKKNHFLSSDQLPPNRSRGILQIYFLTMCNPLTAIVFIGFSGQIRHIDPLTIPLLSFSVFMGSLFIHILLALFGAELKKYITDPKTLKILHFLSSMFIVLFGLSGLL